MSTHKKICLSVFGITQIIVAGILIVSFIPHETIPHIFNTGGKDKVVHLIMYGAYSLVIAVFLWQFSVKRWTLITFTAASCMGIIVEFLQPLLSNRSSDIHDIVFNAIGICLGVASAYLYKQRRIILQQLSFVFHRKSKSLAT
ncbi:MAG: VanZ family protein [Bacteroidales bacterium]|jgi:glycopeptide antibiotics resistance protein|nr:VanZ family protein [Bacteroidales bacterium]